MPSSNAHLLGSSLLSRRCNRRLLRAASKPNALANAVRTLTSDERGGSTHIEYVVILTFMGVVMAVTIASMGPSIARSYFATRATLMTMSP